MSRLRLGILIFALALVAGLLSPHGGDRALAANAPGTLNAPTGPAPTGAAYNPTHWSVLAGATISDTIAGATDAILGSGGCVGGVLVTIQSSAFGNTALCGTLSGTTISFSWNVPATACSTTVVSYNSTGNIAKGGPRFGLAIVDASGKVIPAGTDGKCGGTTPPSGTVDVTKTADPGSCTWTVKKTGPSSIRIPDGTTSATVNYSISATATCTSASGEIIITNSGTNVVSINSISDSIAGVTPSCVPSIPGGSTSLAPGASINCTWSLNGVNAATVNTAAVGWTNLTTSHTDSSSGSAAVGATIDQCATITDPAGGLAPQHVCVPVGSTSGSFGPYSASQSVTPSNCGTTVSNTATLTPDDSGAAGSSTSTVTTTVACLGRTMGYWGNRNGQARLASNNAFTSANAVELGTSGGCYVKVDTAAKSLQIFPNTLNGIGLTGCGATNGLDSGINTNSFNVLLSQTLALSYNIKYVTGYTGETIGLLGCTPVGTLTAGSTVNQVRTYANNLIGNAKSGFGTTVTQTQIGDLNTLLGCLNSES